MSLLTYKDARPWAKSIATQVGKGTMPPWHADPTHGEFLNDRRLTDADKDDDRRVGERRARRKATPSDLPAAPTYASDWTIGTARRRLQRCTRTTRFRRQGDDRVSVLRGRRPSSRRTSGCRRSKCAPAIRASLHHVIVYARPPPHRPPPPRSAAAAPARRAAAAPRAACSTSPRDIGRFRPASPAGRALPPEQRKPADPNDRPAPVRIGPAVGGFAPGQFIRVYQDGTAMKLPAGTTLDAPDALHGERQGDDRSHAHRASSSPSSRRQTRAALRVAHQRHARTFRPARADHRVDAEMTIGQDVTLWSMLPHTHVRGMRWIYDATYPDGRKETILSVPNYDFNWQTDYVFKQPLKLPKGTKIHATAWYDNSTANKSNPDPTKDVWWGDQTWEEMMFTGLTFSIDAAPTPPRRTASDRD